MHNHHYILALLFVSICCKADSLPLFDSDEPLEIIFEVPLDVLLKRPGDRPVVDGHAHYIDTTGNQVSFPIQMTTRGKSRLEVCRFPPLSLLVKKKNAKGTIFKGQKKLKIVTHCRQNARFRSYVLQEQRIYEAFTVLSDVSFRTRYLNVTYRDSERPDKSISEPAFLIESINEVAARTGLVRQKVNKVYSSQLEPAHTTLAALFQFLIGNTDWSVILGPGEEGCCHNGRVLSPKDADTGWVVVPYDFDQAGLIDTDYAVPADELRLRSVRQRLFRGRCTHADQMDQAVELFNERRQELKQALMPVGSGEHKSNATYVDGFYKIINDAKQRERYISRKCMGG